MMTVRVRKTITEHSVGKRKDPKSPTGWSMKTGDLEEVPSTSLYDKRKFRPVWAPAPAPRTVNYSERESYDIRGGILHTEISVDEPITVTLTPREAEVCLSALMSSRLFTTAYNGMRATPDQMERGVRINDIFLKMGVPADFFISEND